jgi:hypothetical protein
MTSQVVFQFEENINFDKTQFRNLDEFIFYLLYKRYGVEISWFEQEEIKKVKKLKSFKLFRKSLDDVKL